MKTGVYFAHCPWPEIEAIHKRVLTALEEDRENDCLRLDLIKIVPYINGRESGFKYVFLNGRSVVIGNDRCHDVLWLFQGPDDGGVSITDKQFASPTRLTFDVRKSSETVLAAIVDTARRPSLKKK